MALQILIPGVGLSGVSWKLTVIMQLKIQLAILLPRAQITILLLAVAAPIFCKAKPLFLANRYQKGTYGIGRPTLIVLVRRGPVVRYNAGCTQQIQLIKPLV
ncbi:hypothetical protein A3754_05120 [Alcanivorax sp. HI0083]|nr:hypothetical protein A3730_03010 [Alcanivorax sp. HI0044]KZZ29688.1 hypothetical protein A3754_05120 [Alcanivorax sp. HI0083]PHR67177.1 MAG: hypothetical protein COA55_08095 [Alcanivorax sp.]